jgi:hypothetical protein
MPFFQRRVDQKKSFSYFLFRFVDRKSAFRSRGGSRKSMRGWQSIGGVAIVVKKRFSKSIRENATPFLFVSAEEK